MTLCLRVAQRIGALLTFALIGCNTTSAALDADDGSPSDSSTDGNMPSDDGADGNEGGAGAGGGGSGGETPEPFLLRVLTLNSWNKGADIVADDIRGLDADVVGLQEVSPAEVEAIVAELGEGWTFAQEDRSNLVAIVSRYPILERVGVVPGGRGGVGATVALGPRLRAHLFVVHLMYTPYGPYQLQGGMSVEDVVASEENVRMPELRSILSLAAPSVASDEASFLVGDFNAPSHLDYEPAMPWPTSLAPLEAGFVDSYAALHPGNERKWACEFAIDDPGITWTSIASEEPYGCFDRIDFVYGSASDAEPIESVAVDVASSDHRAVLTTFELLELAQGDVPTPSLPRDGQTGVGRHALLTWSDVPGTNRARVYLGQGDAFEQIGKTESTYFITDLLAPATTYKFRVDAVTAAGVVTGKPQTFTTRASGGFDVAAREFEPGATIRLEVDGGNAARDWVGLYARNQAYGTGHPALEWKYLNDSQSAPAAPIESGTVLLTAPTQAGEYVLRFFDDDGYRVEDELVIWVR